MFENEMKDLVQVICPNCNELVQVERVERDMFTRRTRVWVQPCLCVYQEEPKL